VDARNDGPAKTLSQLARKSGVAAAMGSALNRWNSLVRFFDDGGAEIYNNAGALELRVVALGRRNSLFASSNAGGEQAAAMYTLIGTVKLSDVDPDPYLRQVLHRSADDPILRITELLPWNVSLVAQGATAPAE